MKIKYLATLALTAATVCGLHAQGTVILKNRIGGAIYAPVFQPEPGDPNAVIQGNIATGTPAGSTVYTGPVVFGAGFTAQLWGGAGTITDPNSASLQAATGQTFNFTTHTTVGFGGQVNNPGNLANGITGAAPGTTATLQLRVWDNLGGTVTTWAAAVSGNVTRGMSALFASPVLGGPDPGGGPDFTPGNTLNLRSFNLQAIPEPSMLAFGALGLAGLLFRRRK